MAIMRVTLQWTGFDGAPGYTNLYFGAGGGFISDVGQVLDRIDSALEDVISVFPAGLRIGVNSEVAFLDESTGVVTSFEDDGTIRGWTSNNAGPYSATSGAVIIWRTDDVRNGRRIAGRTFMVPLAGSSYESDGTLSVSARQQLLDFGNALAAWDLDSELMVWSRPVNGSGGVGATVTSVQVPDMAAVLRSRRD